MAFSKALNQQAKMMNKPPLFLEAYYNTHFYFERPLSRIKYVETRILNSVAEGLNVQEKLPKYVIVVIDKDLMESLENFDFGVKISMEGALTWFVENFDRAIYRRKDDIRAKKPGALTGHGEPRLIFVTILDRPRNTDPRRHDVYKLVTKANGVLESLVTKYNRFCHILYMESINEFIHFDFQGRLTPDGRIHFWRELDEKMKMFDKGQIDLVPRNHRSAAPQKQVVARGLKF